MNNDWNENQGENDFNEKQSAQGQDPSEYAFRTVLRNGRPKTMGWSVASLVLGIVSVVCCCFGWVSLALGSIAIIFSVLSRKSLGYFDGMSIAGLILGIFGLVFGLAVVVGVLLLPENFFSDEFFQEYYGDSSFQGGGNL